MMNSIDNEHWKDIDGYDGLYQVSDFGRVRSRKSGEWMVRKSTKNPNGYLIVTLCKDGKQKSVLVHRLVANAFIPNDDETKTQINHINEDKEDNKVSNLEYCTASYNLSYNGLRYRRPHPQPKRDRIKDLYDPNLTYRENIELFKANGIECSIGTVSNLRKDLGIIK